MGQDVLGMVGVWGLLRTCRWLVVGTISVLSVLAAQASIKRWQRAWQAAFVN